MKFSELITKLHSASQPHMLMYIDIRSDCELADVNILASGQSDVQAGTLYFADAGQLTPDTVLPTNLLYYGTLPPELADGWLYGGCALSVVLGGCLAGKGRGERLLPLMAFTTLPAMKNSSTTAEKNSSHADRALKPEFNTLSIMKLTSLL